MDIKSLVAATNKAITLADCQNVHQLKVELVNSEWTAWVTCSRSFRGATPEEAVGSALPFLLERITATRDRHLLLAAEITGVLAQMREAEGK